MDILREQDLVENGVINLDVWAVFQCYMAAKANIEILTPIKEIAFQVAATELNPVCDNERLMTSKRFSNQYLTPITKLDDLYLCNEKTLKLVCDRIAEILKSQGYEPDTDGCCVLLEWESSLRDLEYQLIELVAPGVFNKIKYKYFDSDKRAVLIDHICKYIVAIDNNNKP